MLGVAIFIPGRGLPVLTLNQIRMVLRIAAAHGEALDKERAVEILTVVAAGSASGRWPASWSASSPGSAGP